MRLFVFHNTEDRKTVSERGHREWTDLTRTIHEHLLQRPILSPGGLFSFGLLDGPQVRLRRPHVREAHGRGAPWRAWGGRVKWAGFGLSRFATAFMDNPG
jgi:hypothetical protein